MSHHGRPTNQISQLREALKDAERRNQALAHVNSDLKEKLEKRAAPETKDAGKFTEPAARLADVVKDVDQSRTLLAEVTQHIGEALQERDALLAYVLARCPEAPEGTERERLPQTHNSRIFKLRIGSQDKARACATCGQLPKGHSGAHLFLGFYDDGRLGECFIQLQRDRRGGLAGGGFHMASRMASLALQFHAPVETVVRQMRYQKDSSGGRPYDADGPLKDGGGVGSLVDYIGRTIEAEMERRKESEGV